MTLSGASLFLDGLVAILLAVTVFFAVRLTIHLKTFRSSRQELETLINTLLGTISQAERSIEGLRDAAREAGRDLQEHINESKALSEELQLITEVGDGMASRLEKQVGHRKTAQRQQQPQSKLEKRFDIHDPFLFQDDGEDDLLNDDIFTFSAEPEDDDIDDDGVLDPDRLQSRAEKELFEALHGNRRHNT